MRISVTEAKGQLTDLVRRAETGDEVILTRHGVMLDAVLASAAAKSSTVPNAARSQDFLYGENE